MFYRLIRGLLFYFEAEFIHGLVLKILKVLPCFCFPKIKPSPRQVMGLNFENPIGLAAGLDKNGDYIDALAKLGFGFIEVGTITPKAQPGNLKPRLFRLVKAQALINRMGFNNKGVDHLVRQIRKAKYSGILGVNIGKNAGTPLDQATEDYCYCFQKVYPYADYVVVNISSPNTPELRKLQYGHYLISLLQRLKQQQIQLAQQFNKKSPLLVKISPDLDEVQLQQLVNSCLEQSIDGLVATNTTITRPGLAKHPLAIEPGGLSGQPLNPLSTQIIATLNKYTQGKLPIIGVGSIMDANDAKVKLDAGASLIQVYTGLIYKGSGLILEINNLLT